MDEIPFYFTGDLDALTRLVLVNGIYFKGKWKTQFDAKRTHKATFYVDSTNTVEVDMMDIEVNIPIGEITELDAKAVSLPYQVNY
jgi:serpin B